MLRKLIQACAGIALSGGTLFASDLAGSYAGQADGQSVQVSLHDEGDVLRGTMQVAGHTLPMAARENNGRLEGVWQNPAGQQIPFTATTSGSGISLSTNGGTYTLQRGQQATAPAQFQAAPEAVQSAPAGGRLDAQMLQGQIFSVPVPAGWTHSESSNETFILAPDGSMGIGFAGLERITPCTPAQFLQYMATTVYKFQNFRVLSTQRIAAGGGDGIEAVISYSSNGQAYQSWVRVIVVQAYGSANGYMLIAGANPDKFERVMADLKPLAEKIQITNAGAAFDRANALAVQRNAGASLNHPMDDTVTSGYWQRQHTQEMAAARDSDVRRGTYTSHDTTTGTAYTHGADAYNAARGGVVNPERPTEILTPSEQWRGW